MLEGVMEDNEGRHAGEMNYERDLRLKDEEVHVLRFKTC